MNTLYTSIYIDADKDGNQLVFNTPYFETEVPSIIALKSVRLERVPGIVVGGPAAVLQELEELLKELEKSQKKIDIESLIKFVTANGGSIRYKQGPGIENKPVAACIVNVTGADESLAAIKKTKFTLENFKKILKPYIDKAAKRGHTVEFRVDREGKLMPSDLPKGVDYNDKYTIDDVAGLSDYITNEAGYTYGDIDDEEGWRQGDIRIAFENGYITDIKVESDSGGTY